MFVRVWIAITIVAIVNHKSGSQTPTQRERHRMRTHTYTSELFAQFIALSDTELIPNIILLIIRMKFRIRVASVSFGTNKKSAPNGVLVLMPKQNSNVYYAKLVLHCMSTGLNRIHELICVYSCQTFSHLNSSVSEPRVT